MQIVYETKWKGMHAWYRTSMGSMYHHFHDYMEMIYVQKGAMSYSINFQTYRVQAGDVIFAFPGQIHGHPPSEKDSEHFVLLFPKNLPVYDAVFCNMLPENPLLCGVVDPDTDALFMQAAKANATHDSPYCKGMVQGYIALILGKLLPHLRLQPREHTDATTEQRLIEYCTLHYCEPITLTEVSDALGYSATYISHLFANKFKIGFSHFINAMRLEDAKKRLRGDGAITQIALDCGFGSMRNFNRVFRDSVGMTPREYRKQNR